MFAIARRNSRSAPSLPKSLPKSERQKLRVVVVVVVLSSRAERFFRIFVVDFFSFVAQFVQEGRSRLSTAQHGEADLFAHARLSDDVCAHGVHQALRLTVLLGQTHRLSRPHAADGREAGGADVGHKLVEEVRIVAIVFVVARSFAAADVFARHNAQKKRNFP